MRASINNRRSERGVALVIAIFTLMLISVIATALILMAGTATSIRANYKTSMQAFYNAKAGLEEGRTRLSLTNAHTINNCVFPVANRPMPLNQACYIVNPDQTTSETVDPTNPANVYADTEYAREFPSQTRNAPTPVLSDSPVPGAGIGGPSYKWVRITATTEQSLGFDVDGQGVISGSYPQFLEINGHVHSWTGSNLPIDGATQVLTVTSLAMTPDGGLSGRRLLQYTVAQRPFPLFFAPNASPPLDLSQLGTVGRLFPAAVTLVGPNPDTGWYEAPSSNQFNMNGTDRSGATAGSCSLPVQPALPGMGVTGNPSDIKESIPGNRTNHYTGAGTSPSISDITNTLMNSEQTVTDLEKLVDNLTSAANQVVQGPATSLPNYGSAASPLITVVRGTSSCPTCPADLTLSGSVTGYGILVVTGTLTIQDNVGWRGIILVIGKGIVNGSGSLGNEVDGALLVAKTRDASGQLLLGVGAPLLDWQGGKSSGFFYDSCWITNAASSLPYQVLSFREIQQQ